MTFRIFTNDMGKQDGVFKYSCFSEIRVRDREAAMKLAAKRTAGLPYDGPHGEPAVIRWPLSEATDAERAWVAKHA